MVNDNLHLEVNLKKIDYNILNFDIILKNLKSKVNFCI